MKKLLVTLWRILNESCEDMSGLISRQMDEPLPFWSRLEIRLHLLYCSACRRYRRQLRLIREGLRQFLSGSIEEERPLGPLLSPAARDRIERALRRS
jgi:hypothetical protein